jgi:hypothetical protein
MMPHRHPTLAASLPGKESISCTARWNDLNGVVKVQASTLDRMRLLDLAHALHLNDLLAQLFANCDVRGTTLVALDESSGRAADHPARDRCPGPAWCGVSRRRIGRELVSC